MASLPETYKTNNEAEKRALELAENFRLQYAHLYPNRMPVLLAPTNEAGISKVICTFVRSGLLEYTDFYYWNTIASFIKDFLTLKLLDRPTGYGSINIFNSTFSDVIIYTIFLMLFFRPNILIYFLDHFYTF